MRSPLGEFLFKQREMRRLSARRLAIKLGMDPSNYSKIERGEWTPTEKTLGPIAEALGITPGIDDEWFEMSAAADCSRRDVPAWLSDERIAAELPALFARIHKKSKKEFESLHEAFTSHARGAGRTKPKHRK
jgi:transcriptional regulator with XRE-family HTH domain